MHNDSSDELDLFDAVESLTERMRVEGLQEGQDLAADSARAQGRQMARHYGSELGREMGYYRAAVLFWRCLLFPQSGGVEKDAGAQYSPALSAFASTSTSAAEIDQAPPLSQLAQNYGVTFSNPERILGQVYREMRQLESLWPQIPLDPSRPELTDVVDRIRAKFRRLRSLLGALGKAFPSFAN